MIIKCPECGQNVSDRARTCPHCGVDIAGQIITCPDCGEVIFKDAAECSNCHCPINGASVGYEPPVQPARRRTEPAPAAEGGDKDKNKEKPKSKTKFAYIVVVVSLVIAISVVLLGLYFYQRTQEQNEMRAYENAISSSEPAVLQNFLDVYDDAPKVHRDTIEVHLSQLKNIDKEWDRAFASKSKAELERYVKRHPGNIHVTEALLLIDSIDWQTALTDNTPNAYQLYMYEHSTGAHVDEARNTLEKLEAMKLSPEEQAMLTKLFNTFFEALTLEDETLLGTTLAPSLSMFMDKANAVPADVVRFMHSLYAPGDIQNLQFTMIGELKIVKETADIDGHVAYIVTCTAEERIDRSNQELERFASYRVSARVSQTGRITALNMLK